MLKDMKARFSEMNKVRMTTDDFGDFEGYVIGSLFREGRWIYKISISEDPRKAKSFDNWVPEEFLELCR
jgi:hypothetical protein